MHQILRKTKIPFTFRSYWLDNENSTVNNSPINLDFNPLIKEINQLYPDLKSFCLIHWQSRPNGLRRWGVLCYYTQDYFPADEIIFISPKKLVTIQLNENKITTVPTAVLLSFDTTVTKIDSTNNKEIIQIS